MGELVQAFLAVRKPWVATTLSMVACLGAGWTARLRLPVPLNEAGATFALGAIWGVVVMLCLSPVLTREVAGLNRVRRRTRALRAASLGWVLVFLGVGVTLVWIIAWEVPARAVLVAGLTGLGLTALAIGRLNPPWLPATALLLATLVFGVDREALQPHAWAWLLSDSGATGPIVSVALIALGSASYLARRH